MKIGAQLYTVRDYTQTATDFGETIRKLAKIGYQYVQISAIGPIPIREVMDICESNGVTIVIPHVDPHRLVNETDAVIADHLLMGVKYIGIGGMPGDYARNAAGVKGFIADFTPVMKKIHDSGMTFMYHNHAYEFEKYDGKLMLQYLVEGLPQAGFTLDTYWVQAGGADPCAWLRALAGRVDVIHLKDMAWVDGQQRMVEVMEGNLNWEGIFAACRDAGVKYAMVEQDECHGVDPFKSMEISYNNLKGAM